MVGVEQNLSELSRDFWRSLKLDSYCFLDPCDLTLKIHVSPGEEVFNQALILLPNKGLGGLSFSKLRVRPTLLSLRLHWATFEGLSGYQWWEGFTGG